jgi:hypothetical protein
MLHGSKKQMKNKTMKRSFFQVLRKANLSSQMTQSLPNTLNTNKASIQSPRDRVQSEKRKGKKKLAAASSLTGWCLKTT